MKWYDLISSVYAAPSHQQRTPTPAAAKTFGDMQVAKTGISTTPVVEGVSLAGVGNEDSQPMPPVCQAGTS